MNMTAGLSLQLKQLFSVHPLLIKVFVSRIIMTYSGIFAVLEVIKLNQYNTTTLSAVWTIYILLAPFIYFFLTRQSRKPIQFEKRFIINFEAVIFGIWLPLLKFNPLITVLFITAVVGSGSALGGLKLFATRVISFLIGLAIGILAFGLAVNLEITLSLFAYSGISIAVVAFSVGYFTYRTAIQVSETKKLLKKEQVKSESLLLNILPRSIAQRLKDQDSVIADSFDNISVLFADLVGFTSLSARMSPEEIVTLLNDIFSRFDKWVDFYGLEKIKTIGDSYMVVGGLPVPQEDHARKMALLALHMQQEVSWLDSELNDDLALRIGIHIGPVVAGVIGTKKFNYDVWGDTVNTASRLESTGVIGQTQVSKNLYEVLKDDFIFEDHGLVKLKGKGELPTYILKREK